MSAHGLTQPHAVDVNSSFHIERAAARSRAQPRADTGKPFVAIQYSIDVIESSGSKLSLRDSAPKLCTLRRGYGCCPREVSVVAFYTDVSVNLCVRCFKKVGPGLVSDVGVSE